MCTKVKSAYFGCLMLQNEPNTSLACYFCIKNTYRNAFSSLLDWFRLSVWNTNYAMNKRVFLFQYRNITDSVVSCLPCSHSEAIYDQPYFDFKHFAPWNDTDVDAMSTYPTSRRRRSFLSSARDTSLLHGRGESQFLPLGTLNSFETTTATRVFQECVIFMLKITLLLIEETNDT